MSRRRWFAVDVHVFDNDLTVDLRDEFGPVGLCMWIGFLAACKRNAVEGKIRYSSVAECLSMLGLPAVELVDEEGQPFELDDFWTFLGQHKQTKVTRSKRLVDVTATRWEEWQKSAKREDEAERKRRSRGESERTEPGHEEDASRTDIDKDIDKDTTGDPDGFVEFWTLWPRGEGRKTAARAFPKAVKAVGSPEELTALAAKWLDDRRSMAPGFVPHASTWLNQERWEDEPPPSTESEPARGFR